MKIPKYIEKALQQRVKAAYVLIHSDSIITDFINKNGIEVEDFDYCYGVEMYVNPNASADRVRSAIEHHNKDKVEE